MRRLDRVLELHEGKLRELGAGQVYLAIGKMICRGM